MPGARPIERFDSISHAPDTASTMSWNTIAFFFEGTAARTFVPTLEPGSLTSEFLDLERAASTDLVPDMAFAEVGGWTVIWAPGEKLDAIACLLEYFSGRRRALAVKLNALTSTYGFFWYVDGVPMREILYRPEGTAMAGGLPLAEEEGIHRPSWGYDESYIFTIVERLTGISMADLEHASYRRVTVPSLTAKSAQSDEPGSIPSEPVPHRFVGNSKEWEARARGRYRQRQRRTWVSVFVGFVMLRLIASLIRTDSDTISPQDIGRYPSSSGAYSMNALGKEPLPMLSAEEEHLAMEVSFDELVLKAARRHGDSLRRYMAPGPGGMLEPQRAVELSVPAGSAVETRESLRKMLGVYGFQVYISAQRDGSPIDRIVILSGDNTISADQIRFVKLAATKAPRRGLTNDSIVARLENWQWRFGLAVKGAGRDWIDVELSATPEDREAFARELAAFCPKVIVGDGQLKGTIGEQLAGSRRLFLTWSGEVSRGRAARRRSA